MNAWSRWLSNPLVSGIAILILVGGLIGTVGLRLFDGVSTLRSAPHDNLQWSLAQLEVELLTFSNAVKTARASEDGLDDVRRRFDVFYSRVNTITTGSVFADLREQPAAGRMLTTITRFLDDTIPLIDGPDAGLRDGLPALDTRIREMRAPARSLAVEGVRLFARLSDTRRIGFEKLLLTASVIAVGMILLLGLTLAFLSRQHGLSLRSAAETRRSEERLSSAINASLDAIVIVDEAGKLIEYNQAAEQVFGRPREKAIGADMAEMMIPHQYREAHALGMARFRSTGEKNVVDKGRFELSALHADGREFPVELSIGSAQGDSGSIFIAYLRDITERRAAEDALKTARDEAMAADRAKSEFIAVMSHEMRTPLNGLLGVLDLMRGTDLDQRQRGYVDVAASSGELLLRHINDVLDIARLEAEGTQLEEAAFDLEALVSSVVEVNRPAAEAKGIAMRVEIDPPAAPLLGDVHRLRQILMNLLGNAVKFTSRGEIRVEAIAEDEGPEGALLTLAVTDTGAGISAADQERIFDDFVTLDPSYSRKATGSGLGLSICRRLASVMGGTIRVESAVGVGSRFWLTVQLQHADPSDAPVPVIAGDAPRVEPVPPAPVLSATAETAAGAEAPREANGAPHPLAILLVEDNETNRFIVREMLDGSGYAVDEACNGQEGVERAAARAYDLILMDISMPVMNGIDATRAIRAGGLSQNATIIGATAHALPEERALFAEAGMQECLAKPIRMETLLSTLDRVASSGAAGWAKEEDVTPDEDPEDEDDLFDDETLGDLTAGLSPERAHRFFTKLADEIEREVARFDEADPENLRAEAHRLAGSAAIAGASALHQALADLETDVARGRLEELPAAIVHARTIARPTVEVLRELAGPATGEAGKKARA